MDNSRAFAGYDAWLERGAFGEDPPEDCPICHAPNMTEDGDPLCAEAPYFCSPRCQREYAEREAAAYDDWE